MKRWKFFSNQSQQNIFRRNVRTTQLAYLLIFLFITTIASAQDSLRPRYGVLGGMSFNFHSADFQALPGIPNCCSQFSSGSGDGLNGGIFGELPLTNNVLLALRASYVDHSATLTKLEPYRIIVNGVGEDLTDQHSIAATLSTIGAEPGVVLRFWNNLFVTAGARVGLVLAKTYAQKEEIISPAGTATFLDSLGNDSHSRTRNVFSGTIPDAASLVAQVFAGVRYELPMNAGRTLLLVPEVTYAFALTDVVSGLTWKPNDLRATIGVAWSPKHIDYITTFDTVYIRDTVTRTVRGLAVMHTTMQSSEETHDEHIDATTKLFRMTVHEHYVNELPDVHDIAAFVHAFGLDDDGNETPIATLKIEEFRSTRVHPLLAYIFFGEGDSVLPARYTALDAASAKSFKLEHLFGSQPLEIYRTVLNIIGYRLKQFPKATLTLTGCNSNQEIESGNSALSIARAEAVKKYLMTVWNISSSRLITASRDLPEKPSNPRTPDGQEENRRVEIACNQPEVLDVFVANDTIRTPVPPQIRLKVGAVATSGVANWNVDVVQSGGVLKHFQGAGAMPANIDWDLANDPASVPRFGDPLNVVVRAVNSKGDRSGDSLLLPTELVTLEQKKARKSGDVIVDRYNLVLFNFNTSDITAAHERIVKMVKSKLKPESTVLIEGYTDRTGSSASNKILSTNRATSTAQALDWPSAVVKGIGKDRLLYPNDTPEGRFFCRTVQITAKTPIK